MCISILLRDSPKVHPSVLIPTHTPLTALTLFVLDVTAVLYMASPSLLNAVKNSIELEDLKNMLKNTAYRSLLSN
jgi:hypothetical protein